MTLCNGVFSPDTERRLVENPNDRSLPHPCDTCGKSVLPENCEGIWIPSAHKATPTDWDSLRANAAKLGISLSNFNCGSES
jgi:hypothetical protein